MKMLKPFFAYILLIVAAVSVKADDIVLNPFTEASAAKLYRNGNSYYLESADSSFTPVAFNYYGTFIPTPSGIFIPLTDPSLIGNLSEYVLINEFDLYHNIARSDTAYDFDFPVPVGDGTHILSYCIQFGVSEGFWAEVPVGEITALIMSIRSIPEPATYAVLFGLASLSVAVVRRRRVKA